jgi:RimJ/RimL family protein N-acetyltransferase
LLLISIRHATLEEKYKTYEWLCLSDTASLHMGEPDYPESPIPDWDQFQNDFEDFYYQQEHRDLGSVMIISNDEDEIGCLCFACFHLTPKSAELDIWLNKSANCGKGYGTIALRKLVEYLKSEKGIEKFIIRPAEKNARAIRAYEKAGFKRVNDKMATIQAYLLPHYLDVYGDGDYGFQNTAVLVLE